MVSKLLTFITGRPNPGIIESTHGLKQASKTTRLLSFQTVLASSRWKDHGQQPDQIGTSNSLHPEGSALFKPFFRLAGPLIPLDISTATNTIHNNITWTTL